MSSSDLRSRVLVELGRGGMGIVYLAIARGPGRFTKLKVVKRLRPDLAAEPHSLAMFQDEARLAAQLHHPNIVQTNEVGFDGESHFLEMEYLEGQSYEAVVRRLGAEAVPLPLALHVLARALAGLHHAHEAVDLDGRPLCIVHRDVSPHNVFVTYAGEVKVLDFGIAKAASSTEDTETGVVKGKATYMAPEQARGGAVDRRADVFAVGVMLWQAVTRQRLWGAQSDLEIFVRLRAGEVPSLRTAGVDVPSALAAICERALAVSPEDRYATAAEMQAAIEAYLEDVGSRDAARELAARVSEAFAADRARVRAEIEAAVREPVVDAFAPTRAVAGPRRRRIALIGAIAACAVAALGVRALRKPAAVVPPVVAPACTSHLDCRHDGREQICRKPDGVCVAIAHPGCHLLAEPGALDDDRAFLIGALFPLTGPQAAYGGLTGVNAIELARKDFTEIAHGIPVAGAAPRPIAIVACDDAADAQGAAHHLVDDLGVPAVIGFKSSQEILDLAPSLFIPRHVLSVASVNMSALITKIPHPAGSPRLVWRTVLNSAEIALPVSRIVADLVEAPLRAAHQLTDGRMRVALVRHGSTAGLSFSDALVAQVRFNGKSVLDNGADFREVVLPDDDPEAAARIDQLVAFRPDVVVLVGQGELTAPILKPLEAAWPARAPHRPSYVFSNGLDGDELFRFIGGSPELRRRVFGVAPPASTVANLKFTLRYNETFADKITLNLSPTGPYDAMYVLAYAAYTLGGDPITGPALAGGIARLIPPGPAIDVGPTRIFEALAALEHGGHVDLRGAGNRLDFDLATGESPGDYTVQCVAKTESGTFDTVETGVVYDPASRSLRGTFRCP